LDAAMADAGLEPFDLASGAGHDAVALAARFPVGMLFVRHPGGISHHPDERVDEADVAVAIDVLTRAVQRLADVERELADDGEGRLP
jgi:allantoate deiminase